MTSVANPASQTHAPTMTSQCAFSTHDPGARHAGGADDDEEASNDELDTIALLELPASELLCASSELDGAALLDGAMLLDGASIDDAFDIALPCELLDTTPDDACSDELAPDDDDDDDDVEVWEGLGSHAVAARRRNSGTRLSMGADSFAAAHFKKLAESVSTESMLDTRTACGIRTLHGCDFRNRVHACERRHN